MSRILMIAVPVILIVAIAVGVGTYRAQLQLQTLPSSSIRAIREAVDAGNVPTVNNLIDLDAVLDTAATEIVTAHINSTTNSMTYSTLDMQNLYDALKPEFIAVAKTAVRDYVLRGGIDYPDDLNEAQRWLKDSRVDTCVVKGFSKPVVNEGVARTRVEFYNAALMFSFELDIEMKKISETEWRVTSAKGFDKYYHAVNLALKERLDSLNAPIRAEIADFFDVKGFDAIVVEGDEYGFSKTLRLTIEADVYVEKEIARIGGEIVIKGDDGQEGVTPFEIEIVDEQVDGVQTFVVDKILNPFVRADANVMRHGLKKKAIHIDVTRIVFVDGSEIKQFDVLPD